tara:strand:+ start:916 stop:1320 length:405 start_codon:yes stop_codon:yes gene_type:complete
MMMANQLQLDITSSAQDFIRNQMRGQQAQFIRLGVEESGCNGFMYTLDFTQSPENEDLLVEVSNDLNVLVSPDKAELVRGTCIELEIEGLNSNIVFKNPNAFSYCGCGESFSLGEDASSNNIESLGDIASEAAS